jgi:N-acetylneuraminate synthase
MEKPKTEIVAEIGINHQGDRGTALRLVEQAAWAGADFVKFQKRDPESCVPPDQWDVPKATPWGEMSYLDYRHRMEFDNYDYGEIWSWAHQLRVEPFFSVWDEPSLEFALGFPSRYVKIPSAKANDYALIRAAARSGRDVVVSTGMTDWDGVKHAESVARQNSSRKKHVIMHSHSAYPAPTRELNLRCLTSIREKLCCRAGYSGHTFWVEPTVWAVALGAEIVEMHLTLDRTQWGSDHLASIEPVTFAKLVSQVRELEDALGDGEKTVWPSEQPALERLRGRTLTGAELMASVRATF